MADHEVTVRTLLTPHGRDGLDWHTLQKTSGISLREFPLVIKSMRDEGTLIQEMWEDWDKQEEVMVTKTFLYLARFSTPVNGGPVVSPVSERHCLTCACELLPKSTAAERELARAQEAVVRTLRRRGPLTLSGIRQTGFKASTRHLVAPALAALSELGAVVEGPAGYWNTP